MFSNALGGINAIYSCRRAVPLYDGGMVKSTTEYMGGLHCEAVHGPSGNRIATDAPADNHGKGEAFSPTDLVGAALAACMSTIMGIAAERHHIDLKGMTLEVTKHMNADPRRIGRLEVVITLPLPADNPWKGMLEQAALNCPVKKSLHPDIDIPITWIWAGQ